MYDDTKYIELVYADLKPEANEGIKFSGIVKINVQFLSKNERRGTNHQHHVYLHVKMSDGYTVTGRVKPFRRWIMENPEDNKAIKNDNNNNVNSIDPYSSYHPLYFRFSNTSGGFGRAHMTEFYLTYDHIRTTRDGQEIKDTYSLNWPAGSANPNLRIPRRLGWINQLYGKDWLRTLIFVHRPTAPGQSVSILGAKLDKNNTFLGAQGQNVPIYHTNIMDKSKRFIREYDDRLTWVPLRKRLGTISGMKNLPLGTPLDWTTDDPSCPTSWLNSGYGFDETNSDLHLGPHYWLLDIIVDSSVCERPLPPSLANNNYDEYEDDNILYNDELEVSDIGNNNKNGDSDFLYEYEEVYNDDGYNDDYEFGYDGNNDDAHSAYTTTTGNPNSEYGGYSYDFEDDEDYEEDNEDEDQKEIKDKNGKIYGNYAASEASGSANFNYPSDFVYPSDADFAYNSNSEYNYNTKPRVKAPESVKDDALIENMDKKEQIEVLEDNNNNKENFVSTNEAYQEIKYDYGQDVNELNKIGEGIISQQENNDNNEHNQEIDDSYSGTSFCSFHPSNYHGFNDFNAFTEFNRRGGALSGDNLSFNNGYASNTSFDDDFDRRRKLTEAALYESDDHQVPNINNSFGNFKFNMNSLKMTKLDKEAAKIMKQNNTKSKINTSTTSNTMKNKTNTNTNTNINTQVNSNANTTTTRRRKRKNNRIGMYGGFSNGLGGFSIGGRSAKVRSTNWNNSEEKSNNNILPPELKMYHHPPQQKQVIYGYDATVNSEFEPGMGATFKFKICDENGETEGAYLNGGGGFTRTARAGMINIIEYGVPGSERYLPMNGIRRPICDFDN